ncbi:MAG TPA: molybdopterin-dependent oxidoreductase [Candidatus Acidoferrales bacterium]|nr:molybdopterin-dependent oxidoreductase [Candidatus Acidoferrales bacterium]
MRLTIDNHTLRGCDGESVLQCALRHNIRVPHLCTHPSLPAFGACRMCVVEIDGMRGFPASCATPAAEGMVVRTDTAALRDLRRSILELILIEHPSACLLCDKQVLCEELRPHAAKAGRTTGCHTCNNKDVCEVRDLARDLHISALPVPPVYRDLPLERSDPFIDRDLNLCILCGRCVRICKAQHGRSTIDFIGRGSHTHIGEAFGRSLTEAGCRFCGSCIDVCPTGSLADRYAKWYGAASRFTATTCILCDAACAVTVHASAQRRAVMAHGINTRVPICVLGRFAIPEFLNGAGRLKAPQVRIGDRLREVAWPQALAAVAERLTPFVGNAFALVCDSTSTLEDRHVFQRFTREVMQSPHYVEIQPDEHGVSRSGLPGGVRAALLTGDFVDLERVQALELLIVQDCYATPASECATVVLPAAVLAEVGGTWVDGESRMRPLRRACDPPGVAKPDWQIVCELAVAMAAAGFAYESAAAVAAEIGVGNAALRIKRADTPLAASDPTNRRTHFRGHCLAEKVGGLRQLPATASSALAAVGG